MKYKSQKVYFATYTDGTEGLTYTLSLDNDYDILVFDQQNNLISSLPEVKATRQLNGDTTNNTGNFGLSITPKDTWIENTHYTFNKSSGILTIKKVPTNFTEAAFLIQWNISDSSTLTKTFTLKKQVSNVDYEIEVNKNVINSTNLEGTINIKVKKKDINGSKYLTDVNLEEDSLALNSSETLTWNSDGYWTLNYDKGQTRAVTIELKQGELIWDIETIEFVLDGEAGREEIGRDRYYCITDTNETPSLYENFNDATSWWKHGGNVKFSENGLQITVDDKIDEVTVFAMKAEQWPESRLVSFEGWITSEDDDDGADVDEFYLNCDLVPRNHTAPEDGYPQFIPRLTKERRRYSYLMELGPEANINNNKEVSLRLFSDISHNDNGDRVPNDIYIENLIIQPLSNNTTWTKNTYVSLEKGQYLWSFDIIEYSKEDAFGNKYSVTPIEQRAYLATDGDPGVGIQGTKTESIRVFYSTNPTDLANTSKPGGPGNNTPVTTDVLDTWTTYEPTSGTNRKLTWSCTGVKTTTYKDAAGTIDKVTYGSWTTPELYKAYATNTNIDPLNYATFLRLSNFKSDQDIFYNSDGKMYINAELMNVGSLLVNDAFSVAINGGQENLALKANDEIWGKVEGTEKINAANYSWKLVCPASSGSGIKFPASIFENGVYYTLKFYIKPISGILSRIGGHSLCAQDQKFYIDGIEQNYTFDSVPLATAISADDQKELECVLVFKFQGDTSDDNLYIQPNRATYENDLTCIIRDITLYKGKADPGNIITKINADAGGIKLQGNRIDFTTSEFVIKDTANNPLFAAYGSGHEDITKRGTVSIAGWEVDEYSLTNGGLKLFGKKGSAENGNIVIAAGSKPVYVTSSRQIQETNKSVFANSSGTSITLTYTAQDDELFSTIKSYDMVVKYYYSGSNYVSETCNCTFNISDDRKRLTIIATPSNWNNFPTDNLSCTLTVSYEAQKPIGVEPSLKMYDDGSFVCQNADISGNISGSDISGGTISGATITGGKLSIGAAFDRTEIDSLGRLRLYRSGASSSMINGKFILFSVYLGDSWTHVCTDGMQLSIESQSSVS